MSETGRLPVAGKHGTALGRQIEHPSRTEGFEGDEIQFRDVWATLKRRRLTVLFTTIAVLCLTALYTLTATPVWYARTLLRVEAPQRSDIISPTINALTGLQGGGSEIETELRILHTRPIAEDVVDRNDLNLVVTDPRDVPRHRLFGDLDFGRHTREGSFEIARSADGRYRLTSMADTLAVDTTFVPGERVSIPGGSFVLRDIAALTDRHGEPLPARVEFQTRLFPQAVEDLLEALSASRPDREANVLQLAYRSTDRQLVYEVPNSHAESFIERRIAAQKMDARSTVGFLEDQVEETRQQLEDVEARLQDFREGERIVALGPQAEAQVQRLATLQTRRMQLQAERSALSRLLSDIEEEDERPDYRRLATFPTFFGNQAIGGILESLIQADSARSALLTQKTPNHPDVIASQDRIASLEKQLGSIGQDYLGSLDGQIAALDEEITSFTSELEAIPEREIEFARIQRQVDMLGELYTILQTRLKEAQVKEAIDDSSVRIVERATDPLKPISPRPVRAMALALLLGLVLGVVLALIRDYVDRRLHSSDRIEDLFGLPTMARIPAIALEDEQEERKRALIALQDSRSIAAESFRNLRTNVNFVRKGRGADEIVVTSPSTDEGKSLTAANLAIALAQKGRRTLLVDADMRRPVQHAQFDVPQVPGLSECLLADEPSTDGVSPTMLGALFVLPSGQPPPNPAELLDSEQMERLLKTLRESYDAIIIDAPPVLAVTDSAALAPKTDGVILVVRAEKTEKDAIALAIRQLRQVNAEILGIVVNDAKAEGSYQSYYENYRATGSSTGLKGVLQRITGAFS